LLKWLPELKQRQEDHQLFHTAVLEGERPIECYFGLFLITPLDRATAAKGNAKVYFRELGFQLMDDRYVVLPLFLQSLPFGAERRMVRDSFRYRTLTTRSVLPLLPLFSEWSGTSTPSLNLFGRRGEWMQFSLFDSNSNYNAVIAAQSGSGKSFFTNELILNALEEGAQVWIIDVGRSYQNLAESLGGDFVAFGSSESPGLNPFASLRDWNEEADLLTGLITAMAAPREPLSDFQSAVLKQTLQTLHTSAGATLTIDQVAGRLMESQDLRIRDLGSQLHPFTSKGEYGQYFNRPEALSFRSDLTVLELEELKGRRHLQQVVLLQLILAIQQAMYQGDRARPKLVIIDEAWDLLTMGETAQFIEHGYRRFRKYGGSALTITQSVNDLYRCPTGRAIAENSAHLILMGQKSEAIDQLKAEERLPLDAGGYALLKTLRTEPGRYSECFILSDLGAGIGRLQVDPYRQLLYSTRPIDVAALRKLRREGLSLDEAIKTRLNQRGLKA
jgi:conjugal transfer ATP-binding protein TraC